MRDPRAGSSRDQWSCQACPYAPASRSTTSLNAPKGGADFDLDRLVPACHAQTDAPYGRGRLVITPLGQDQFTFTVVRGTDKWATRS
jgi:hypothetical protein